MQNCNSLQESSPNFLVPLCGMAGKACHISSLNFCQQSAKGCSFPFANLYINRELFLLPANFLRFLWFFGLISRPHRSRAISDVRDYINNILQSFSCFLICLFHILHLFLKSRKVATLIRIVIKTRVYKIITPILFLTNIKAMPAVP